MHGRPGNAGKRRCIPRHPRRGRGATRIRDCRACASARGADCAAARLARSPGAGCGRTGYGNGHFSGRASPPVRSRRLCLRRRRKRWIPPVCLPVKRWTRYWSGGEPHPESRECLTFNPRILSASYWPNVANFLLLMSAQLLSSSSPDSDQESFAALFQASVAHQEMRTGEVISAQVVRIDHNFVVVNAGLKSESYIPVEEFLNDQGALEAEAGDFVSVAIEALENGYGDTILSRDKAKRLASWLALEKALEENELITGTITGKVKGGLTVMVNGIRAFLPGSLIDTRPVKDATPYEGKTLEFRVIK